MIRLDGVHDNDEWRRQCSKEPEWLGVDAWLNCLLSDPSVDGFAIYLTQFKYRKTGLYFCTILGGLSLIYFEMTLVRAQAHLSMRST